VRNFFDNFRGKTIVKKSIPDFREKRSDVKGIISIFDVKKPVKIIFLIKRNILQRKTAVTKIEEARKSFVAIRKIIIMVREFALI
jgi:hypothetical protein